MTPGRRGIAATLAAGLALLMLLVAPARADKAMDDLMFELQLVPVDKPAPAFELERLSDGKKVSLAEFKGRPVLVYFWATW